MISNIAHYAFSAVSVPAYLGSVFIGVPYILKSPLRRAPLFFGAITAYSALKTGYYAFQFFQKEKEIKTLTNRPEAYEYKNTDFKYEKSSLNSLKQELKVHTLKKDQDNAFQYTCKVAKLIIPVFGIIWVGYDYYYNQKKTSIEPKDTWTDITALEFHINYLERESRAESAFQEK